MFDFKATLELIGINPFVFIPKIILQKICEQAHKDKGKIPVYGTINQERFQQTLVKYSGEWRLYINTKMLKKSPQRIGEVIEIAIAFDPTDRSLKPHPSLVDALAANQLAKAVFDGLCPSRRHEIIRYIANLKTAESVDRNILKAIDFLVGKGRFAGRDKP